MKKKLFLLLVIPAVFACSVKEIDYRSNEKAKPQEEAVPQMVISATLDDAYTKTQLSGNTIVWEAADQIRLFNSANPAGVVYTLSGKTGGTQAQFTGPAISGSGPFYAVYPASSATGLSGSAVSVDLPQVQVLTPGSFGKGASLSMAVVDNIADNFYFQNAMGAVCFTLEGATSIKGVRVQSKGTEALCGSGSLSLQGGVPTLALDGTTPESQTVSLEGTASTGPFYMMLPPDALAGGFMAEFKDSEDMVMVLSGKASVNNTVNRSEVRNMPAFSFEQQIKAAFLETPATAFGFYDKTGTSETMSAFGFDKLNCQYATSTDGSTTRHLRVQSLPLGKYYSFETPYTLDLGETYDSISVESVVGSTYTAPTAGTYRVIRTSSEAAWLATPDWQKGIILWMED